MILTIAAMSLVMASVSFRMPMTMNPSAFVTLLMSLATMRDPWARDVVLFVALN